MIAQPDLFGAMSPPPERRGIARLPLPSQPAVAAHVPPPPNIEWARLLTRLGPDLPVWIHVSRHWAGVILETACDGPRGRWGWHATNGIVTFAVDSGCRARIVYIDPPGAHTLHSRHPMVRIGTGGDLAARFRFAAPGEDAPRELDLPLAVDLTFERVRP